MLWQSVLAACGSRVGPGVFVGFGVSIGLIVGFEVGIGPSVVAGYVFPLTHIVPSH